MAQFKTITKSVQFYLLIKASFIILIISCSIRLSGQPFYDTRSIEVNNIKAASGLHGDFWHSWNGTQMDHGLEFPKGSGKFVGFSMALWMAGYDAAKNLRAAATTYRTSGQEFWPGPLSNSSSGISMTESEKWAKIWHVSQANISTFKALPTHTLTNTPPEILGWSAKGNPYASGRNNQLLTITEPMAPFVDIDNDGVYNALNGDYPKIKGDEMQWMVYNDFGPLSHNEITNALPLGIEVRAFIYGYNSRPILNNVLFYEFEIINRQRSLDSFVLGVFADADLGYAVDDYIGFDSVHNTAFFYNGAATDGLGDPAGYLDSIPTLGIRLCEFPGNNCNVSSLPNSFMYFMNNGNYPQVDPTSAIDIYHYLNHTWRDSTPLRGPWFNLLTLEDFSDGHGGIGALKQYTFDGSSSSFGNWHQCTFQSSHLDRKIAIGLQPRQLNVGDSLRLAFALVITDKAKNNGCPSYTVAPLFSLADSALSYYCQPPLPTDISEKDFDKAWEIFPNPVHSDYLNIKTTNEYLLSSSEVSIYNTLGEKCNLLIEHADNSLKVNIQSLQNGCYYLVLKTSKHTIVKKIIKLD